MKIGRGLAAGLSGAAVLVIGGGIAAAVGLSGGSTPAGGSSPSPSPTVSTSSVTATPVAATVTVTPTVTPSTKPVVKRKEVKVNDVGDPTTSDPANPPVQDLGTGTVDEGGVRRAPVATSHPPHPTEPKVPVPTPSN